MALAPYVVPVGGVVPLVGLFKAIIDAPGAAKVVVILMLVQIVLIILALLAWLPAPASGVAKPLAWLLILWRSGDARRDAAPGRGSEHGRAGALRRRHGVARPGWAGLGRARRCLPGDRRVRNRDA